LRIGAGKANAYILPPQKRLTTVLRSCGGKNTDRKIVDPDLAEEEFNCNAHLLGKEARPANFVHYLDIGSLYPFSGIYHAFLVYQKS
jgi:hypothetical protein